MKKKNLIITLLVVFETSILIFLILFIVDLNNKVEEKDTSIDLVDNVDPSLSDSLYLQIDSLKSELEKNCNQKLINDSIKKVFNSDKDSLFQAFAKKELNFVKKEKKLEKKINSLNEQNSSLIGHVNSLKELVSTYNSIGVKKNIKTKEVTEEPLIVLEPETYFKSYIEIITDKVIISKAVLKDKNGKEAFEFEDPIILSTNRVPSGIYYLSFYNESGELIEKASIMYKK
ncbi:MAG: hypothetical protein PF488_00170 [Patescibacteria group bacterium]|jgi:hypothetical protein|nr:hypothetical protein [Patescibacteria group bacterium]